MGESTLETRLRNEIKKIGGLALKIYCLSFTGLPDRLVLLPGGLAEFVEMKAEGKTVDPKKRQALVHRQLRALGFNVTVINSRETLDAFIEKARLTC